MTWDIQGARWSAPHSSGHFIYPPDAAARGKKPSSDGEDVEAVRRTVSRAGRAPWEWATGQNKLKFSNTFSHGKDTVTESGLAGVQRQLGIDPTGWMGEATYNGLRSIRIPQGLPHAGEPAMDQTAVDLLEQWSRLYKGDTSTVRAAALAKARTYIGYVESPAGTNCNMFGAWYGAGWNYEPWCFIFVTYCFELGTDHGSPSFVAGQLYSYCPYGVADARANRNGLSVTDSPMPGDLVFYDWERNGEFDHVGIFESGTSFSWRAVEGNTSTSNQSNGGSVMLRDRSAGDANVVFVRVAEP